MSNPIVTNPQALFQSFDLHGPALPNRMVLAPMTRARSGAERIPNKVMADYYAQRAAAGLLISEATTISAQANGWNESPGIYSEAMVAGWRKTIDAVHQKGGRIFLQLWHCGRASHSDFHGGDLPVAPSAIKIEGDEIHTPQGKKPYETPRALRTDEIPGLLSDYRSAAERAKAAGFDGVEIHSANGYLLDEFLQAKTNQREDRYGGTVENRYRLLGEVVATIGEVWRSNQVGVRLSPNGAFNDMGSKDFREQFLYAAQQLNRCDLAYLHVMDGLGFGFHELGKPMTLSEFRTVFKGPLIGNVGYTKETAEATISAGDADLIAFGRPFISNPDLVSRFQHDFPIADSTDMSTWYAPTGAKGYTDYPVHTEA